VSQVRNKPTCGPSVVVGGEETPSAGCGGASMYAKSRWDPKEYFAARDAEWKATVSVGALEVPKAPPATPAEGQPEQH
jgi:hypothetical protein